MEKYEMCRICLSTESNVKLHSMFAQDGDDAKNYARLMRKTIDRSDYPTLICNRCSIELNAAAKLLQVAESSEASFKVKAKTSRTGQKRPKDAMTEWSQNKRASKEENEVICTSKVNFSAPSTTMLDNTGSMHTFSNVSIRKVSICSPSTDVVRISNLQENAHNDFQQLNPSSHRKSSTIQTSKILKITENIKCLNKLNPKAITIARLNSTHPAKSDGHEGQQNPGTNKNCNNTGPILQKLAQIPIPSPKPMLPPTPIIFKQDQNFVASTPFDNKSSKISATSTKFNYASRKDLSKEKIDTEDVALGKGVDIPINLKKMQGKIPKFSSVNN